MIYREFEIRQDLYWADKLCVTSINYDGPDDTRCWIANTIDEAKKSVDTWYYENMSYLVFYSKSLAPQPFTFWTEAVEFCKYWGFDLSCIEPVIGGFVTPFEQP